MDALEYDGHIFGMLFLKRVSDEFEEAHQRKFRQFPVLREHPLSYEDAKRRAKDPSRNKEFSVPEKLSWPCIQQNLNNPSIEELLNTDLYAIEDCKPPLKGILKLPTFNGVLY